MFLTFIIIFIFQISSNSAVDIDALKKELCPFPGYHGLFCPNESSLRSFLSSRQLASGTTPLPKGVGIALDITTGDLKFPVLSFSEGTSTWTDPLSGLAFSVPREVQLSAISTTSAPEVRVFQSEFELTNVWTNAIEKGQWLGGEFGEAKQLNNVFDKFFKDGTSTAVTQQRTSLYSLKTDSKKLNQFAQYAVNSLPKDYSSVYNQFLDSWGTHIAVQTTLGGMKEQQTVFKDCVWTSPYFTNGLTQDQLEATIRDEFLDAHGDYAYYVARRKMTLDHRFGGSPDSSVPNWMSTIAQNPALLRIDKFEPWDQFVTDPTIAANLNKAIAFRVAMAKQTRDIELQTVKQQRIEALKAPRPAKGVAGYGSKSGTARNFAIGGQITLAGTDDCPQGLPLAESISDCNTGITVHAWFPLSVLFPENPRAGEQELDLTLRFAIFGFENLN